MGHKNFENERKAVRQSNCVSDLSDLSTPSSSWLFSIFLWKNLNQLKFPNYGGNEQFK